MTITPSHQVEIIHAITPMIISAIPRIRRDAFFRLNFRVNKICAAGGIIVIATITEAISAKVFVNARGLKSLPSGPVIVKTGRKPTTVVATAVRTAPATSLEARWITSSLF